MSVRPQRHWVRTVVAVASALIVAGCSTVMDGSAVRDPGFQTGQAIAVLLQTGNYPTTPKPLAPNAGLITQFEAQRMAGYVIYPWEVDPGLTALDEMGTRPIISIPALSAQIPGDTVRDIAAANGFINGFTTSRGTPDSAPGKHMALNLMVLRFPDPDKAAAASIALAAQYHGTDGTTDVHSIPIPGHPEATAVAGVLSNGHPTVSSFSVHGAYVFYVFTQTDDTADTVAALIGKALDLQGPRIDQYQVTDPAQFATQAPDPTGLLARSLPRAKGAGQVIDGVWERAAALHLFAGNNPNDAQDRFTTYGIDDVVVRKSTFYRAKDATAAAGFAALVAKDFADGTDPGPAVPGFPAAKCFTIKNPHEFGDRVQCEAPVDRYVITVFSKQSLDAIQQISAQYQLLIGK